MTTRPFAWHVDEDATESRLLLMGELGGSAASEFEDAVERICETAGPMVIDFSGTDYINSTGIALIVTLLGRARAAHRSVRAVGLNDHYREIFRITRLADFMTIDDHDEALA